MSKSAITKQIAQENGWDVIDIRLPESLQLTVVRGLPRVDVKALIEQSRRRQAQESLISYEAE